MAWRQNVVALVMVVAAGCSGSAVDESDPLVGAPTTVAETSTSTSTTTTIPVPPDVQDLMVTTTMTERARRLFLAASPAIEDAETFARNCGVDPQPSASGQPQTHTQGCYVSGRIHLRVPDRAEGRELVYVVAAHELLHAVYASLGTAERARIDAEVTAARSGNERLEERLKSYEATPTLTNEIHSILGSEFEGLSPALEAHYGQFFANRAAVVGARQRTLGAREDEIKRLRASVDDLEARIDDLRATQEALRSAGNISRYNANVPVINGLISRFNAEVDALNTLIDEYNGLLGG